MKKYLEKINTAKSIDELNAIITAAEDDENLTNANYYIIMYKALTQMLHINWGGCDALNSIYISIYLLYIARNL